MAPTRRKNIPDDVTAAGQTAPSASARPTVTPKAKPVLDPLLTTNPTPSTAPIVPKRHNLQFSSPENEDEPAAEADRPVDADVSVPPTDREDGFRSPSVLTETEPAGLSGVTDTEPAEKAIETKRAADADPDDATGKISVAVRSKDDHVTLKPGAPADKSPAATTVAEPDKSETIRESSGRPVQLATKNNITTKAAPGDTEATLKISQLVARQTYFVPINAVARRRSRIVTILLVLFALILLVALADLLLDIGIISYNLPHTHFFQS